MVFLVLLGGLATCGDPLVDGGYLGEALFVLEGQVFLEPDAVLEATDSLVIAVFWTQVEGREESIRLSEVMFEQSVQAEADFPAQYSVRIHTPPAASVLQEPKGGSGLVALGLILIYSDRDGDGAWDRNLERLLGGSNTHLVVYSPHGAEAESLGGRIEAGFQLMALAELACLEAEEGLAQMMRVQNGTPVDLTISPYSGGLLPDLDCDERWDVCEDMWILPDEPVELAPPVEDSLLPYWDCVFSTWGWEPPAEVCDALYEQSDEVGADRETLWALMPHHVEYCDCEVELLNLERLEEEEEIIAAVEAYWVCVFTERDAYSPPEDACEELIDLTFEMRVEMTDLSEEAQGYVDHCVGMGDPH